MTEKPAVKPLKPSIKLNPFANTDSEMVVNNKDMAKFSRKISNNGTPKFDMLKSNSETIRKEQTMIADNLTEGLRTPFISSIKTKIKKEIKIKST